MSTSTCINGSMRKWKRYPAYNQVATGFVHELPSHWQSKRVEYVCDMLVGFPFQSERFSHEPNGIPLVRGDNVTTNSLRWGDKARYWSHDTSTLARYFLNENDVVIGMDGSKVGKNYAIIASSDLPLLLVQRVARLRAGDQITASFLFRSISNQRFHAHVDYHRTDPAIPHITLKDIGTYIICLPPVDEQHHIVAFLDRETAKIDALIAKKERLIELLQEKRTALISHAVTKGIDPTVPMKDSSVEWLGKIPAHWGVIQSRRVFKVRNQPALESDEQLTASQKYGMLPQTEFMEREGRRVVVTIKGVDSLRHVEPNDYVISLRSFQGGIEWCKLSGSVTFHYVVLKPVKTIHPPYFGQLFKSSVFIQALRATTDFIRDGQDLRYSQFVLVPLPVVPMDEQAAIASFLDRETDRLDRLIAKVGEAIDKLREYRTALISAAVTGKIDVREEVA